ncbi:MAG: hypothetical protein KAT58_13080, partial [candidate division Zixibacteria bacterium]|nr:hypothetical protein [candidate division Zixibacteria bacterium]
MKVRNLCGSLCLKWRLILVVSLLLVVSCAALSVFLISEFSASAVKSLERYAASLSKNLAHNAEFGVMLEIKPELDVFSAGLVHGEDVIYV